MSAKTATIVAGLASVLALSGCQSSTTGSPTADTQAAVTPSRAVFFDPCTTLSPSTLDTAGLDSARGSAPYEAPASDGGEKGCTWFAVGGAQAKFSASLGRTTRTVDQYLSNTSFQASQAMVAGRPAASFVTSPSSTSCNLAVEISGGTAIVAVNPMAGRLDQNQSCATAEAIADALAPELS